jgi:hypothetical protein
MITEKFMISGFGVKVPNVQAKRTTEYVYDNPF